MGKLARGGIGIAAIRTGLNGVSNGISQPRLQPRRRLFGNKLRAHHAEGKESRGRTLLISDKNTHLPRILMKISRIPYGNLMMHFFFFLKETQRLTLDYTIFPSEPGIIVRARRQKDRRMNKTLLVSCRANFFYFPNWSKKCWRTHCWETNGNLFLSWKARCGIIRAHLMIRKHLAKNVATALTPVFWCRTWSHVFLLAAVMSSWHW